MGSTFWARTGEIERQWLLLDGTDQVLGRMAARIAMVLMGKHKPTYTPHLDTGDHVVVVNAEKIRIAPPEKPRERLIRHHTGFLGNFKQRPLEEVFAKNPAEVLEHAVKKMLPKHGLARHMVGKLHIYSGEAHPHAAQKPVAFPEWI